MECPNCKAGTHKLIGIGREGIIMCPSCFENKQSAYNYQLNQTESNSGGARVTNGKAWEIKNRVVSKDDGKTVINKVTGKPAQY
jgi:hypothetical protein